MRSAQRAALTAAMCSVAKSLASKDGENTEYDRAMVDLTASILGLERSGGEDPLAQIPAQLRRYLAQQGSRV